MEAASNLVSLEKVWNGNTKSFSNTGFCSIDFPHPVHLEATGAEIDDQMNLNTFENCDSTRVPPPSPSPPLCPLFGAQFPCLDLTLRDVDKAEIACPASPSRSYGAPTPVRAGAMLPSSSAPTP